MLDYAVFSVFFLWQMHEPKYTRCAGCGQVSQIVCLFVSHCLAAKILRPYGRRSLSSNVSLTQPQFVCILMWIFTFLVMGATSQSWLHAYLAHTHAFSILASNAVDFLLQSFPVWSESHTLDATHDVEFVWYCPGKTIFTNMCLVLGAGVAFVTLLSQNLFDFANQVAWTYGNVQEIKNFHRLQKRQIDQCMWTNTSSTLYKKRWKLFVYFPSNSSPIHVSTNLTKEIVSFCQSVWVCRLWMLDTWR